MHMMNIMMKFVQLFPDQNPMNHVYFHSSSKVDSSTTVLQEVREPIHGVQPKLMLLEITLEVIGAIVEQIVHLVL